MTNQDVHFGTSHLLTDLKGRAIRSGAITVTAQGVKFILQMGSTMVLARLLTPYDFGLIAMVTVVTGFASRFKDAGLSMATIQREKITHEQVSTLFWINVTLSVVMMLIIAALAPAIAWFYGKPELIWITFALAGTFIFSGLTVQHQALLRRQMRFKALAIIDVISMVVGILTAILMAFLGFEYWSLVGLSVGAVTANCLLVWFISGWKPGRPVRSSGVRSMLAFGSGLTGFSMLNYFTRNADNVIIGFALGSAQLGIYSKAYNLLMMPIRQFNAPVGSVMIPALSRLQNDPARYRRVFLHAIGMLAMLGMPLVAFLFVVAEDAVAILLGPGWEEAASVFRWLAPAALFGTVNVAPGWLCISLGRAKIQLIWGMISAPLIIGAFIIGTKWGIIGVSAAFSITWCLLLILFIAMACNNSPVSFLGLMLELLPTLLLAVGTCVLCILIAPMLKMNNLAPWSSVIVNAVLFAFMYLILTIAVPSSRRRLILLWKHGYSVFSDRTTESEN